MNDGVIRRALAVNRAWLALGNECFEAEGAIFVRNRAFPDIYDANHVARVTAETTGAIDQLLARVELEFAGYAHRRFDVDFTTPPAFEGRLVLDGYERSEALVMLLEGELVGVAKPHEIRPVVTEADWRIYTTLHDLDWGREKQNESPAKDIGSAMARSKRAKSPPVSYWLAYVGGQPQAYFSSSAGVDGVGQIEDLFTHPDFRHRGLATALIHHCVNECRREGVVPVVIVADATPKHMYATVGFRPIAIKRNYRKDLAL